MSFRSQIGKYISVLVVQIIIMIYECIIFHVAGTIVMPFHLQLSKNEKRFQRNLNECEFLFPEV